MTTIVSSPVIPAHPDTCFDEVYFVELLAGSISLTIDEKKSILEHIAQLSQHQIDELIKIFEEEKAKFDGLRETHAEQVDMLRAQHAKDWADFISSDPSYLSTHEKNS